MRILQIHSSDHQGGGGGTVAMERLHQGLLQRGVQSSILAGRKTRKGTDSECIPRGRWSNRLEQLIRRGTRELGLNDVHYVSSFRARDTRFAREADVLHIHGTHGWFNYLALPRLTRDKPALFTLHDMWPLTGHCAFSGSCERWQTGCGECPDLKTHPAVKRDNTALEWRLKQRTYRKSQLEFIAVSRWIESLCHQGMLAPYPVHYVPNGIDTSVYQPIDRAACRDALGIADARWVIIFVALTLGDRRKGGDLVAKALSGLPEAMKQETCLVVFGDGGSTLSEQLGIRTLDLGYVRHDRLKAIAYSAADVCLLPTRLDNLPLVLQESLACGTPMLATEGVGGVPEVVREGITGRLGPSDDGDRFSTLLQEMLEDDGARARMSNACRKLALEEYDDELSLDRHLDIYQRLAT